MKSQFAGLFVSRAVGSLLQALSFLILVRVADVPTVGLVGIVTSAAAFAAIFFDLGVATTISRARARGENALVGGALRLNDLSLLVMMLIGAATIAIVGPPGVTTVALILLFTSLAIERNCETILSISFADKRKLQPAVSILGRRILATVVFVGALVLGVTPVLAYCIGQLTGAIAGLIYSETIRRAVALPVEGRPGFVDVGRVSWPFWISSMANQSRTLDVSIAGWLLGSHSAGLYSAAQKLVNPTMLISTALASVVLPHSTRLEPHAARQLARRLTALYTAALVPLLVIAFFAEPISIAIFGPDFARSAPSLAALVIFLPFVALASPLTGIMQGLGRDHANAVIALTFGAITVASMIAGALLLGITGIPIAIGVSSMARCVAVLIVIHSDKKASLA